ncbi:MAG: HP0268 family nuclease [Campylobacteraceae bacterium]
MELKLARTGITEKPKAIKLETIEKEIEEHGGQIFYFDKENSNKDLMKLVEHFEKKDLSVYLREVRYGLNEGDYMYEVHIL